MGHVGQITFQITLLCREQKRQYRGIVVEIEEQLRRKLRQVGHKYNTEQSYVQRYHQFIQFVKRKYGTCRHPAELGKSEIG